MTKKLSQLTQSDSRLVDLIFGACVVSFCVGSYVALHLWFSYQITHAGPPPYVGL